MQRLCLVISILISSGTGSVFADDTAAARTGPVSYYKEIRPIFQQHCLGCHQPARPQGGFVMTDYASLLKKGEEDKPGVVPGKPEVSYLLDEIRAKDGKAEMPKGRDALADKQYKLIEKWIVEGAKDDTPVSAKAVTIDASHPPKYPAPPVVTAIAYSPDGRYLAVSGYHEVLLHNADGSGIAARFVGLSERVQSIAFSPDGSRLAVAGGDPGRFGEVQIWDIAKRKLNLSTTVTFDTLYGISWSPDGSSVAFGCADNTVRAIDALTGKQILQMGTHSDWVLGTAFSRDGQYLASVSRDMSMKLTEVSTQRFIDNVTSITPGALKGGLMAVASRPKTSKWFQKLPEDTPGVPRKIYDELLIAGADGIPRLYKMHREAKRVIGDDSNKVREYPALTGRVSQLAFDHNGKRFAGVGSLDGQGDVKVYDADAGKMIATCKNVGGAVYTLAWHPNGQSLAVAGFDGVVKVYDPTKGNMIKQFSAVPLEIPKATLATKTANPTK